jgi:hypothetical protein
MRGAIFIAVLAAILFAFYSEDRGGPVYPVPLDRARQILSKTDLPPVFGSNPVTAQIQTNKPSEVTWIVSNNGSELMRYTATLGAAGEGKTRIGLELRGSKGGPAGDVEKRFAENPSIKNLYLVAMKERIASDIEGRSLDMSKIYPALGAATVANIGNIRKSVDEAAKASEELDRAHSQSVKRKGG